MERWKEPNVCAPADFNVQLRFDLEPLLVHKDGVLNVSLPYALLFNMVKYFF